MTQSEENANQSTTDEAVTRAVDEGLPSAIADLGALVRIPSVSWAAFDAAHVAASADAVAALLRGVDIFDAVTISRAPIGAVGPDGPDRTDNAGNAGNADNADNAGNAGGALGQPAVLASRAAKAGRPTVLLYAHHDVQPQGQDNDWETAPFEPTVRGDRLYGRGAADDKAGVMAHVAALRALAEVSDGDLDLGVVVFIEGEEEYGSRSFANFLRQHQDTLAADVIVVADSDNWDINTPALTVSLRGNVTFHLTVRTLAHASHSGMFGGAVPDAMLAMIRLLATLHSEDGSVAVAGLHAVEAQTPEYDESQLREEAALLDGVTPIGTGGILSRLWTKPSITVTGIDAPSVANASNTLSPAVTVQISARIAPGQAAGEAFAAIEQHLREHAPFGAGLAFDDVDTGEPFLVDTSGWAVDEVKRAMADGWGVEPVETGIGGSIPFIADLVRVFPDAQILVTGVEDPDTRAHSPNESLHLGVFKRAILTEALFLARLNGAPVDAPVDAPVETHRKRV